MQQFPSATITSVTVAPGEKFAWVVFKKKKTGRVTVLKDVTWKGKTPFDGYRFTVDQDGKRHEFVVPYVCGNVALKSVGPIPRLRGRPRPAPPPAPAPTRLPSHRPRPSLMLRPSSSAPPPPPQLRCPRLPSAACPSPVPSHPRLAPVARADAFSGGAAKTPAALFDVGLSRQPAPQCVFAAWFTNCPHRQAVPAGFVAGRFAGWATTAARYR
jgi:hypothetical protein